MMTTRTKLIHNNHMWACGTALLVDTQTNYPCPPACDKPFNSTFMSTHKYWMIVKVSRTETRSAGRHVTGCRIENVLSLEG